MSSTHALRRAVPVHLVSLCAAVFALVPLLWALKSSLTPTGEVLNTSLFSLPSRFTFENYTGGWDSGPWGRYFLNSFAIASAVTMTTVAASATAGYGFAKYRFPGRNLLFSVVMLCLVMPFPAVLIPLFVEMKYLDWISTYQGLIIPGSVSAFGIFLTRQFMADIPDELIQAARIDGCSEAKAFLHIVLPIARPVLSALAALTFLASWNNYLWPLVLIQDSSLTTVPLALAQFQGAYGTDYGRILAMSVLGALPALVVFLIMRRRIVDSLATSGLK